MFLSWSIPDRAWLYLRFRPTSPCRTLLVWTILVICLLLILVSFSLVSRVLVVSTVFSPSIVEKIVLVLGCLQVFVIPLYLFFVGSDIIERVNLLKSTKNIPFFHVSEDIDLFSLFILFSCCKLRLLARQNSLLKCLLLLHYIVLLPL